jgi:hypothetical protein
MPRKLGWWRRVLAEERSATRVVLEVARDRGPLEAWYRVRTGELGGPTVVFLRSVGRQIFPLWGRRRMSLRRFRLEALLVPPLMGAGILLGANEVLEESSPDAVIGLAVLVLIATLLGSGAAYLLALRPTRGRVLGVIREWSREDLAFWGVLVLILPTAGFAAIASVLVHAELIGYRGISGSDSYIAFRTFETFVWSFADAIPFLKVPETLNWTPHLKLTTASGGALLLAYKVMLLLPVVQLITLALARSFGQHPTEKEGPDGLGGTGDEPTDSTDGPGAGQHVEPSRPA